MVKNSDMVNAKGAGCCTSDMIWSRNLKKPPYNSNLWFFKPTSCVVSAFVHEFRYVATSIQVRFTDFFTRSLFSTSFPVIDSVENSIRWQRQKVKLSHIHSSMRVWLARALLTRISSFGIIIKLLFFFYFFFLFDFWIVFISGVVEDVNSVHMEMVNRGCPMMTCWLIAHAFQCSLDSRTWRTWNRTKIVFIDDDDVGRYFFSNHRRRQRWQIAETRTHSDNHH